MIPRARVIRRTEAEDAKPLLAPGPSEGRRRRIAREEVAARVEAARILGEAGARAEALVVEARVRTQAAEATAVESAREQARADLAARWVALRTKELERIERDADRVVPMAVALAERLLGASLSLEPARIADLARGVLEEARGARRAAIDAHPADAEALRRALQDGGLDTARSTDVREDPSLARGELRLHTDVGTIDARFAPRFDRLASALRDALE